MSARSQWQAAIRRTPFPVGLRPVKATLLSLPITADGNLTAWREELTELTGLPLRTLDRHLARAVDAGWLVHPVHGGHGRAGHYRIHYPEVARHKWPTTEGSCAPPGTRNSVEVARHVVAKSIKKRERRREHLALDTTRHRNSTDIGTFRPASPSATEERIEEEAGSGSLLDVDPPVVQLRPAPAKMPERVRSRRCVCGGLRIAGRLSA